MSDVQPGDGPADQRPLDLRRVRQLDLAPFPVLRCGAGRDSQPPQHPPHRGCAGLAPEAEQLAPDPGSPSPGSPSPSARSAPRAWRQLAAVLRWEDRSTASGPAADASAAACPASPADSSAPSWGAAGPGRQAPSGPPSPASAWGAAAAARPLSWRITSNSAPSTPTSVPATPSSQSAGRRSGRASVLSQARDTASRMTNTAGELAVQTHMPTFGTLQAYGPVRRRGPGWGGCGPAAPGCPCTRRRYRPGPLPVSPRQGRPSPRRSGSRGRRLQGRPAAERVPCPSGGRPMPH